MGAFIYVNTGLHRDAAGRLEASRAGFRRAGFEDPVTFSGASYALDYYGKIGTGIVNAIRDDRGGFLASIGTPILDGSVGHAALRALRKARDEGRLEEEVGRCAGQFALIAGDRDGVVIHRDANSSYELFHTADLGIVSSSFLAVATALPRRSIDRESALEFVFNGVTLGTATPIREVRKADLGETLHLARTPFASQTFLDLSPEILGGPVEAVAERAFGALADGTRQLIRAFGGNMTMALSGGYDTRLLLALFRHAGTVPRLFVYGGPGSQDVRIASGIARAEGLPLEVVDKHLPLLSDPDELGDVVRRNFHIYDGYSQIWIFRHELEHQARAARHAGGALNVHGGAGEVLRNFFGLPNRPVAARNVVAAFFSQFDPRMCRDPADARTYRDAVTRKITGLFGTDRPVLSRQQVEAVYPHLRCRSWFGRDNSINGRAGYSNLPFYEGRIVDLSLRIPVRYKDHGDFQSRLIRMADPALAKHLSQYGRSFEADAPFRQRVAGWLGQQRPALMRRNMARLRLALRKGSPQDTPFGAQLLGWLGGTEVMSRLFDVDAVTDMEHLVRIGTLEYLYRFLEAEMPGATTRRGTLRPAYGYPSAAPPPPR